MADYEPQGQYSFNGTVTPAIAADRLGISNVEQRRLNRYVTSWQFYHGRHWSFERETGDPLVTLNYVRAIADKHIAALVRGGVRWDMDLPFRETLMRDVEEAWRQNNGGELLYRMAQCGSVTGDHFTLVTWRPATEVEKVIRPEQTGYVVIEMLQPSQVFPEWDPLRRGVMRRCKILKYFYHPKADKPGELEVRIQEIDITPEFIIVRTPGADGKSIKEDRSPNLLKEVPVIHWPNLPNASENFGIGDVFSIIPVQRELNEKATDASDIINYWASPIVVITGAKVDTVDVGAGKVWSNLPEGSKVDTLKHEAAGTNVLGFLDFLRTAIHELGNVPEGSLGSNDWNGDSGEILASKMQPLLERRDAKVATWTNGLRAVNYLILRYNVLMRVTEMPTDRCRKTGGLVMRKVVKKTNALNETVSVTVSSYVVRYDPETGSPKILKEEDAKALREAKKEELIVTEPVTFRDPKTGEDRTETLTMERVPVGEVVAADPYCCEPRFPDNLPKDQIRLLQVFAQMQKMGIIDREWLMRHCAEIDPDEVSDLLERTEKERMKDLIAQGLITDRVFDQSDAEIIQELSEADGDMKRIIDILGRAREAFMAEQQGLEAGRTNVGGSVPKSSMIEPGKKRRKEK